MSGASAIILAAGHGRRFGAGAAKGFIRIHGRSLLSWSLEAFARHSSIGELVVVIGPEEDAHERAMRETIEPLRLEKRVVLAIGGERRQDSSLNGVAALSKEVRAQPSSIVLIHDAARPLLSGFLISRCLRALEGHPDAAGVLPALPVRETLKRVNDSWIEETVDRTGLMAAQTPQAFRLGELLQAHERARKEGIEVTDDAMLLEACGRRVRIVPGDLENIKVTYPEDRIFVDRLLRDRERT